MLVNSKNCLLINWGIVGLVEWRIKKLEYRKLHYLEVIKTLIENWFKNIYSVSKNQVATTDAFMRIYINILIKRFWQKVYMYGINKIAAPLLSFACEINLYLRCYE